MERTRKQNIYWRRNLRMTGLLLAIWFLVTFVVSYYARELNALNFFGFPLGFYMGGQGALLVYLAIIWYYNRRMRKLEAEFGMADE